jgi:hypothetical protein
MIQLRLKRKYLSPRWAKQCGFGTDDQGSKRRRKNGPKTYDRTAHVLHMGPTGKTRMVHL